MKISVIFILYICTALFCFADEIDTEYYNIELKEISKSLKYWNFDAVTVPRKYFYLEYLKENFRDYYRYYEYYLIVSGDMMKMREDFFRSSSIPEGLSVNLFFGKGFKVEYNVGYKIRLYFDSEKIAKGEVAW